MTALEQGIARLCELHGFHAISFGINTNCSEQHRWSASVHWEGFSRDDNPCEAGHGPNIASALQSAIECAKVSQTPVTLELPDVPLALGEAA